MDKSTKIIGAAAGVAGAVAGIAAARKRRNGSDDGEATYHVRPRDEGWAVEREGSKRAESRHDTKRAALTAARELAHAQAPSRLVIHRSDDTVQDDHRYEAD